MPAPLLPPSANPPIRILLIEDYELVLQGLQLVIKNQPGMVVVGSASIRIEALELAACQQPDIILLDLQLGQDNGIEMVPELLRLSGAKIIIFTGTSDPAIHSRALHSGAHAVVIKGESCETLTACIEKVHAVNLEAKDPGNRIAQLTTLERDVIGLLSIGQKEPAIAEHLSLNLAQVKKCLLSARQKLQVPDRIELVVYAHRYGLASISLGN